MTNQLTPILEGQKPTVNELLNEIRGRSLCYSLKIDGDSKTRTYRLVRVSAPLSDLGQRQIPLIEVRGVGPQFYVLAADPLDDPRVLEGALHVWMRNGYVVEPYYFTPDFVASILWRRLHRYDPDHI